MVHIDKTASFSHAVIDYMRAAANDHNIPPMHPALRLLLTDLERSYVQRLINKNFSTLFSRTPEKHNSAWIHIDIICVLR